MLTEETDWKRLSWFQREAFCVVTPRGEGDEPPPVVLHIKEACVLATFDTLTSVQNTKNSISYFHNNDAKKKLVIVFFAFHFFALSASEKWK